MNEPVEIESIDREIEARMANEPHPRAVGTPLSMGSSARQPAPAPPHYEGNGLSGSRYEGSGLNGSRFEGNGLNGNRVESNGGRPNATPVGRALNAPSSHEEPSGFQRAINVMRMAIPLVQRILPLLDGNIGTTVSNLLAPHHPPQPQAPPPPPKVDLAPLEDGLSELRVQHRNLRDQLTEQNGTLKRVEDQLEMVREATDRNTLEQQELLEDLKSFSNKVKVGAIIAIGLLTLGIVLNLVLYLHIQRVLP